MDFLGSFVGSTARAKCLRLFLFNQGETFTAAEVAKRAQITRPSAQKEISFLKRLGMVKAVGVTRGGRKTNGYQLDDNGSHTRALSVFVRDASSIDESTITAKLRSAGRLKLVIASGTFVDDTASRVDLLVVADALNERKLQSALRAIEADLGHELRYAAFLTEEFNYRLAIYDRLIRDVLDYPHRVFLDRLGVTAV